MVRAWYMDDSTSDQRLPHMTDPPHFVKIEEVQRRTGVEYFKINVEGDPEEDPTLKEIREKRGYGYQDHLTITEAMEGYLKKIEMFYTEHLHADEEIRLILDGAGYFDVRENADQWLRVEVVKGDMLILPAGIYHRFTLDTQDFISAKRYFCGEPVWTAISRPADENLARVKYLASQRA